ncbi:nuclear transport factor 2 family protein [Spirosoma agri]|uniref:Nuclear transport factor 2 family protein n=1 Tax=Spirosoma agri TaxID=1987381 RepID=A0A6M0IC15_9BACT|nr:nuclear transport factor 2 family protein [Spirosoma agri]NEU65739.1 nuclear transport factor 2 family protein [Spirosoma agri]
MKAVLFLLASFACFPAIAQSPTDEAAVRASINQLFESMKKADSTLIKSIMAPGARLQTVMNKQGEVSVQDEAISKFIASVGKAKPGSLDERLSGMDIKIDGELATAWTPYSFYYNGQQSHCGVNAFTLVKLAGAWKIQTIIDTRRKQNCP